jgi:hypothetical protein
MQEKLIEYLPSLFNRAIQYYSCFISYSTKDQDFADRIYTDLQQNGVRCWFAPHDLPIGGKILDEISEHSQVGSVHFNVLGPDAGGGRPTANWSLIAANFSRVDEVIISGSGSAFLHDNTQIGPAVPEPSTWAMMLLGFAGLGFLAYRRQEKTVPLIGTP